MNNSEKIDVILKIFNITDIDSENILDDILEKINHLQKISEFNIILIQEMIKSDIIPPLLLKRSQLLLDLKNYKNKICLLGNRYDIYIKQKAEKNILDSISREMLEIQIKIENIEEELKHL